MANVDVVDIPGPAEHLCWRQDSKTMVRCDRRLHHKGLHSWEIDKICKDFSLLESLIQNRNEEIDRLRKLVRAGFYEGWVLRSGATITQLEAWNTSLARNEMGLKND